jgi:hypothetical protein
MLRLLATGVVLLAVGALVAAPVPAETRKPAAFPAGHYVLTGADEPAQGNDVFEFTKTFRLKSGQYVLSGGPKPTDLIVVDDDLEVYQEKTALFIDDDNVPSTFTRGKQAAKYQGRPIVLVLDAAKKLRVRATDYFGSEAIIGPVWLHRWDGAAKKLTEGKSIASAQTLPDVFFDESFALADGFEMPEKVSTDAVIDVPEKPATLLPRFKPTAAPVRPARADAPKSPDPKDFITAALTTGLTEDGIPPAFVAQIAKRDDFIGKCSICGPTQQALLAYGKLDKKPVAKEGKGLTEELVKRLQSDDNETRRAALREMVRRYVEFEFARRDLSEAQKEGLQKKLDEMRKSQASGLPTGQKFCPSCDGACRLAPKP